MRAFSIRLVVVVLVAALVLAACSDHGQDKNKNRQKQLASASATPQAAVQNAVTKLKAGDFDALLQHVLPPAAYQQLREQWAERQKQSIADVSEADRQRFAKNMRELTAPDAKEKLFAKLQPALEAWDSKYKQRVPMMVGIFRIMVGTRITQSDDLTAEQKSQARGVLDAVATWAQTTHWGDQTKAKKAVGIVVDTARALDLKTLEQAYKLDYEPAMQRYGTVWNGFKQLLSVYGFSVNAILDSVKVKTLAQQGNSATVEVSYTILGQPVTSTLEMVRKDKRWYMRDVLERWHEAQAELAHGGSAAPAASTAPATSVAPASSVGTG